MMQEAHSKKSSDIWYIHILIHTLVYNKGRGVVQELQENNEDDRMNMFIFVFCAGLPYFDVLQRDI